MLNYSNIFVSEGMTYPEYRLLIDQLLANGQTTGPDHSEGMLEYTKLNVQRMNRLDKTVTITDALAAAITALPSDVRLLVISEGWCGDAAQIVPVLNQAVRSAQLPMKLVLRDKNLELIDAHLTNGGRAIPVLLVIDADGRPLGKWGPRPAVLQQLLSEWKQENPDFTVVAEQLHGWYAKDRTLTTQQELTAFFDRITAEFNA
ncbi:thioredoxin family protein [Pedobacter yulinensis]|uniref:Thioredoxin family protein n=1 Tax=Pedobacter yulinensis TaxID=2126353 RepID=A0A2T3HQX5_9SPHI|nr:thioredoxin family protein [Pedobacter yulinensis]PST84848.1 thioredoxin family protein [Pedobacter yulinensis]